MAQLGDETDCRKKLQMAETREETRESGFCADTWSLNELLLLDRDEQLRAFTTLLHLSGLRQVHVLLTDRFYALPMYAFSMPSGNRLLRAILSTCDVNGELEQRQDGYYGHWALRETRARTGIVLQPEEQVQIVLQPVLPYDANHPIVPSPFLNPKHAAQRRRWTLPGEWVIETYKGEECNLYLLECAYWHNALHHAATGTPVLTSLLRDPLPEFPLDVCTTVTGYVLGGRAVPRGAVAAGSTSSFKSAPAWLTNLPRCNFSLRYFPFANSVNISMPDAVTH